MSKGNNFYKVLGVSRTASQAQIKKTNHKKSRDHHPDKHGSQATEKMQEINRAHEILSDPESRKKYDMTGEDPSTRQPRNKQPFGSDSGSGPGYCASCDNDPCACFIFKPAGSSKPSHSHSPTTCWECHQDLAGVKYIKLSCGCCAWCSKCADRAFQTTPDQTQKTLHQEIRVTFEEAQTFFLEMSGMLAMSLGAPSVTGARPPPATSLLDSAKTICGFENASSQSIL
jgi:DnaJ-class molecular chaperone